MVKSNKNKKMSGKISARGGSAFGGKTKIISVILALAFSVSGQAFAAISTWTDVSGNNAKKGLISGQKGAETNITASESGKIYAAFQDKREQVFAKEFDGTSWSNLPGSLNTDYIARNGDKPALAAKENDLYIAYKDLDAGRKAKVKRWNGSTWSDLADTNHPQGYISDLGGFEPVLCFDKSKEYLYAAFRDEASGEKIKVMKWNDISGWNDVSDANNPGGLISIGVASEADIKASKQNDDIFVAFEDIANDGKIRVKKWDGSNWSELADAYYPGGVVSSIAGYSPSIDTDESGNLYLVYTGKKSRNTYIHKWNGSSWEDIGGGMAVHGTTIESTIAIDGRGYLYLAYSQKTKIGWRVRVKVWADSQWVEIKDGKSQNISKRKGKGDPSLAVSGNKLYMSFTDARNRNKVRVKMLNFQP